MHAPRLLRWIAPVLVLAVGFVAIAAAVLHGSYVGQPPPSRAAPTPHVSHQFLVEQLPSNAVWNPGQRVTVHWLPSPSSSTTAPPAALRCTLALYGPYPTRARAEDQETKVGAPPGTASGSTATGPTPAVSAAPLALTDTMDQPQVSVLELPPSLAPGYYVLRSLATTADTSGGGGVGSAIIVQIAHP